MTRHPRAVLAALALLLAPGARTGRSVVVGPDGRVRLELASREAVAIRADARL